MAELPSYLYGCRIPPKEHQIIGVQRLVESVEPEIGRVIPNCFALFDEMGAGKSKQIIDAAHVLYEMGQIDVVVIVAPAYVRNGTWFHPVLGQLKEHLWDGVPSEVTEYHSQSRSWFWVDGQRKYNRPEKRLIWIVTNYEFLREESRLKPLLDYVGPKTWLVLDESTAVKNPQAIQAKACLKLRAQCGRVTLLNGTPIGQSLGDIYMQAKIMDWRILGLKNWTLFRARYALLGPYMRGRGGQRYQDLIGWRHRHRENCCELAATHPVHGNGPNAEEVREKLSPYILRRLKIDCLDLPPKLSPVTLEVPLSKETWKMYKGMEEEFIVWLDKNTTASANQAGVRSMRLAQITSGLMGGVITEQLCDCCKGEPSKVDPECRMCFGTAIKTTQQPVRRVSNEKAVFLENWVRDRIADDPYLRLLIWCRFRDEIDTYGKILSAFSEVGAIWGGQTKAEREHALTILQPSYTAHHPVSVLGTPAAGGKGLNLTGAHTVMHASHCHFLENRLQADDRVHRPGQTYPVSYFDLIATGPNGQKTVDSVIIQSLRRNENMAAWTCSRWRSEITEE